MVRREKGRGKEKGKGREGRRKEGEKKERSTLVISAMEEMTKLDLMKSVWLYDQHWFFRWCSLKLKLKKENRKACIMNNH